MGIAAAVATGPGPGAAQVEEESRQREMLRTLADTNAVFAQIWTRAVAAPEPEIADPQSKLILEEPKATEPIVRQFPELDFSEQPEKPSR